jgi:hypothetical protein
MATKHPPNNNRNDDGRCPETLYAVRVEMMGTETHKDGSVVFFTRQDKKGQTHGLYS